MVDTSAYWQASLAVVSALLLASFLLRLLVSFKPIFSGTHRRRSGYGVEYAQIPLGKLQSARICLFFSVLWGPVGSCGWSVWHLDPY